MIITNSYFTGELYIPHAIPSVTDNVTQVNADMLEFIERYERDCLIKSLGLILYNEFVTNIDILEATLIDSGAQPEWDELMNGKIYVNPASKTVEWRGIRYKNISSGAYNRSFLANYVYFFFEQNQETTTTNVGDAKLQPKNAKLVGATDKVVNAWREFIALVQGDTGNESVVFKPYGIGVDYYTGGSEVNLYKYIKDQNTLVEDTYAEFNPKTWKNMNRLGI